MLLSKHSYIRDVRRSTCFEHLLRCSLLNQRNSGCNIAGLEKWGKYIGDAHIWVVPLEP